MAKCLTSRGNLRRGIDCSIFQNPDRAVDKWQEKYNDTEEELWLITQAPPT
jgi:hypothetical protein